MAEGITVGTQYIWMRSCNQSISDLLADEQNLIVIGVVGVVFGLIEVSLSIYLSPELWFTHTHTHTQLFGLGVGIALCVCFCRMRREDDYGFDKPI